MQGPWEWEWSSSCLAEPLAGCYLYKVEEVLLNLGDLKWHVNWALKVLQQSRGNEGRIKQIREFVLSSEGHMTRFVSN